MESLLEGDQAVSKTKKVKKPSSTLPPMLQQYIKLKKEHERHILLFQVGDFYEIFFEDAKIASSVLGIRLTARHKDSDNPVPMCGVPIHALENYLPKLVKFGHSAVVVSQVGEADKTKKGGVRREITRVVTPGIRFQDDGLDEKQFNFLASVCFGTRGRGAISYIDVSTGFLRVQEADSLEELLEILQRVQPAEFLIPSTLFDLPVDNKSEWLRSVKRVAKSMQSIVVQRPFDASSMKKTHETLEKRFPEDSNQVKVLEDSCNLLSEEACSAILTVLDYVDELSFGEKPKLADFKLVERAKQVFIDSATRRNLEITETRIDGESKNSLLSHIDYTKTPMGARLFADYILAPCSDLAEIKKRHDSVEEFVKKPDTTEELRELLAGVRDIDRLSSRIACLRATPRDLGSLRSSIEDLTNIKDCISELKASRLASLANEFDSLEDVYDLLSKALVDDPPSKTKDAGIFREDFNAEVDELRKIKDQGHGFIAELEASEKSKLGIQAGLKVKYNNVFGYFIEITKSHLSKIPEHYERKQTLVNAERFITQELKDFEVKVLSAKDRLINLEKKLFAELLEAVAKETGRIQLVSKVLAELDVLASFSNLAREHNYTRPKLDLSNQVRVVGGRHPVVERVIGEHNYVENDISLNDADRKFAVLTGPNMGGKSTYLRQVGLIQLLAQAGSFVPARSAELGLVDRIFTRIGAADDLARGDSTFMVEMREAAAIVKRASSKSLVLIDEIGRGTATADGLAIATAVAEWLHDRIGCRTIFATHFHELTQLADVKDGVFCLSVGVYEKDKEISFTHRIEEKAADRSYGVEVARLAGLPEGLLKRAEQVLNSLDSVSFKKGESVSLSSEVEVSTEMRELADKLRKVEPDSMTPIEALQVLGDLKKLLDM